MRGLDSPNDVGPTASDDPASDEDDHLAPAMDPQSGDPPSCDDDFEFCWDFGTITICDVITTLLSSAVFFVLIMACFIKLLSIDD